MYNTDGPPGIDFTTCRSHILSNNVFPMLSNAGDLWLILSSELSEVFFCHFLLAICKSEKAFIQHVNIVSRVLVSEFLKAISQGAASASGGEHDPAFLCTYFRRVN